MSETATHVIRYSKEVMIGLHDSPLVQRPESMPLLSTWFGDDSPMATNKSILNGAITSRTSSDKSIILGPTKTNFASSLYGGLKEKNNLPSQQQHQQQSRQQHHHHRQLDNNNNNNSNNTSIKEYRSPRGPSFMGEKGFSGNNNSSQTKKYNNASSPPLPQQQNKRFDLKANNRASNNNTRYQQKYEETERIPEWMDYSPEDDEVIEIKKEQEQVDDSIQAQFTNDLEAWKSNMKKRDGIPITATPPVVENNKPMTKDISPMNVMNGLEIKRENSNKGGSRFAKFFAKREQEEEPVIAAMENTHISAQQQPQQARSISLDDLFQKQPSIMPSQQQQQPMPQQQQQPMNQQGVKVFSEQDILKSLGANNKVENNEDAMGFNRVLQILSQPKPSSPGQQQEKEKLSPSPNTNRLSSNLPTSVLRQMSSRSSNSSSPSSLKATVQPQQQQQQQQQQLPPHHQLSPQQPYYNSGYASPPPAANSNMLTFEQLVQLNNGMPPVLPPHLRNNMMIPPPPNGRPPVPPVHMQHMMNPLHLQQLQMQQGRFPPPPPMQQLMNNGNSGMNQQQMHHPGMHPAQYHPQQQQMFNNNNQSNKNW